MATIQSQLRLNDGMSVVLRQVTAALNTCLASYEQVQAVSQNAMDINSISEARVGLSQANALIDDMAAGLREIENKQNDVNRVVREGTSSFDGALGKIMKMAGAYMSIQGLQKVTSLSDDMASTQARLSLIVDDGGSVESLEAEIFASAQRSRGSYMSVLDTVSKLGITAGDSFSGNDEIIRFAELMNQNFIVAGASATEQSSAMYQLTQAMAAGKLQGDEYRSIIENAPLLANSIEDYMRNVQGAIGNMKDWSAQGLLTADVIKNALFNSAEQTEARFAEMPYTWEQVWTGMGNNAIIKMQPLLTYLNNLANDPRIQGVVNGLLSGLDGLIAVAVPIIDFLVNTALLVAENWGMIAPVIVGLAAAWGVYAVAVNWATISQKANALWVGISTVGKVAATASTWAFTSATLAQAGAQYGLNAALYACPIVWIIMAIIAVIAVIYAVVGAMNKFAGTSISATGIICGAFMFAAAVIGNVLTAMVNFSFDIFVVLWNFIASFANFFANVFTDPVGAIARLFFDLVDTVLALLQTLASAIDTIFGSNLAGSVQGWRDSLGGWVDDTFGAGVEVMPMLNASDMHLKGIDYGNAISMGYNFGEGIDKSFASAVPNDLLGNNSLNANTYGNSDLMAKVGDIAGNTSDIAGSVAISGENLEYLRDIAERDVINRFTTAEIKIDMPVSANINSGMDLDGIVSHLTTGVNDAMEKAAEGVHT